MPLGFFIYENLCLVYGNPIQLSTHPEKNLLQKMIDAIKKSFPDELIHKLNYPLCIKTEVIYMAQVSENDIN